MSIDAVTSLLRERLGLDPASLGNGVIEQAIAARQQALGRRDHAGYAAVVSADEREFQALAEEVTVPETWFFRGGIDLFAHLAARIRDASLAVRPQVPFRVLSAPCSSGEEAYSLAIALAEAGAPSTACTIDGIDISQIALRKASAGRYRDFSFRQTDPSLRERYFRSVAGEWEIAPVIRESVRFRSGNLVEPAALVGGLPYDLIFCRNLLIYLHAAARARLLDNVLGSLAVEGLLCTGHAEPIQLQDARFELVPPERFMLFQRVRTTPPTRRAAGFTPAIRTAGINLAARSKSSQPNCAQALDDLARARNLADAGHLSDALEICQAHLDQTAPSADAYALLGILRQARHEKDEAMCCFEKALYLRPDHDEALTHLMLLCEQLGQADRAATLRRRLQRVRSGDRA
jgi:chemotaxis protein methyltransferase WspC